METIAKLADPRTGVPSKCKFLPTIADVVEIAKGMEPPWTYKPPVFQPDPDLRQFRSIEERKAFVKAELGYDPIRKQGGFDRDWCFEPRPPAAFGLDPDDFPDR